MSTGHDQIDQHYLDAIADADQYPYWMEDVDEPDSNATLVRTESCDLCVVGGGYTGLWTAIIAKERDPSADVVLIDAHECGSAASGRNGGFMDASLTHGVGNAMARWPDEIEILEELGRRNLNEIEAAIRKYEIDCDYERTGVIEVANKYHPPTYLDEVHQEFELLERLGHQAEFLDAEAMQAQVHSPIYTGGLWTKDNCALVDPARLVWGLKAAAERLGVRIYEDTKATELKRDGIGVIITTPLGAIRAGKVALATNAFKPLLKRLSSFIAPVYDYCMVTQPLTAEQMASIGWKNRQGLSDLANQFHYYRLDGGQPHPVGRLRRRLLLGRQGLERAREPPRDVGQAQPALLRDVPATRGRQVHPHVGRRDRHVEPVHGVLGARDERSRRVRARIHRARRRRLTVRRLGDARPSLRTPLAGGADRVREVAPAPLPARAVPVRRHPGHDGGAWTARTRPASAISGCAASTRWDLGFDS